jgi:hypothetical protein
MMFLCFSVSFAQSDWKVASFLDPKIDTVAFINCSKETLDTIISHSKSNPKFIIDNDISCNARVNFSIEKDFTILIGQDDVNVNLVFRNKQSKKYSDEIRKYYKDQAIKITLNLFGLFVPDRVSGQYYSTKFYLNIDFTKGEDMAQVDSLKSKVFKIDDLSDQSIAKNKKLREKGIKMLKNRKPSIALVYFRMAYYVNKDIDSVVLLGNLWDIMGEPEAACYHWKKAAELGNKQAESLIKKCVN